MKKSLFALAALGAFAGATQAQSSVTVYGILDVGFQGVATRAPSTSTSLGQPVKTNTTGFTGEGSQSTSRLGFRGTEDLGGGTRAFFTVEFALNPTNATLSGNNNNGLSNRQTFVGLAQKGIGQFAIGTQYTPIHVAISRTDPGQQNNILGDVIYAPTTSTGAGQTTTAYTVRYNQALTLQTERIAGFQLNAIYNNSNSDTNQLAASGGPNNNNAYGGGINYVWQKLNVDFAYQASQSTNWATQQTTGPALPLTQTIGATVSNVLGASVIMNQMYAGAVYDFGILKAYAQYISNKVSNQANTGVYLERTAQQIGVRGNLTKTIESWASVGNGRFQAQNLSALASNTAASATQNFTGYQLGSNYWMSKRTNLYAIFGSTQVSSSSVAASEGGSSYGIGVRHTF
jgi:predicted porin